MTTGEGGGIFPKKNFGRENNFYLELPPNFSGPFLRKRNFPCQKSLAPFPLFPWIPEKIKKFPEEKDLHRKFVPCEICWLQNSPTSGIGACLRGLMALIMLDVAVDESTVGQGSFNGTLFRGPDRSKDHRLGQKKLHADVSCFDFPQCYPYFLLVCIQIRSV